MAKHSRVLQFVGGFNVFKHADGTEYKEEEKPGLVEVRHDHANHAVEMGVMKEFASDMAEAKQKVATERQAAQQASGQKKI